MLVITFIVGNENNTRKKNREKKLIAHEKPYFENLSKILTSLLAIDTRF